MKSLMIRIQRDCSINGHRVWMARMIGGNQQVAKINIEWQDISVCQRIPEDNMINIRDQDMLLFIQALNLALIDAGLKIDESKTAGELEATKKHLEDMRKHVDKLINALV